METATFDWIIDGFDNNLLRDLPLEEHSIQFVAEVKSAPAEHGLRSTWKFTLQYVPIFSIHEGHLIEEKYVGLLYTLLSGPTGRDVQGINAKLRVTSVIGYGQGSEQLITTETERRTLLTMNLYT